MSVGGGESDARFFAGFEEECRLARPGFECAVGEDEGDTAVAKAADTLDVPAVEDGVTRVFGREFARRLAVLINVRARGDPERVGVAVNGREIVRVVTRDRRAEGRFLGNGHLSAVERYAISGQNSSSDRPEHLPFVIPKHAVRIFKSDRRGGGAARLFVSGEESYLAARARCDRDDTVRHQLDAVRIARRRFGSPKELALGVGDHTAVSVAADRERNGAVLLGMAELCARDVVIRHFIGPDERAFIELAVRNIVDLKVFLALIGQRDDVGTALDLNADVGVRRESEAVFRAEHSEEGFDRALGHKVTAARDDDLCANDADNVFVDRQALASRDALGAVGRADQYLAELRLRLKLVGR